MALGADLAIEQTKSCICPECGGGEHKDVSFSITRTAQGFIYNCFRLKCGIKGFARSGRGEQVVAAVHEDKPTRPFLGRTFNLSIRAIHWLGERYGISEDTIRDQGWLRTDDLRLYMPLFDSNGMRWGAQTKSWTFKPKAITYWERDFPPKVHFPLLRMELSRRSLVIVEDVLSSARLAGAGVFSCALLGSDFRQDQAGYLLDCCRNVILVLDKDTWPRGKPQKFKDRYGSAFDSFRLIHIERDVKDMTQDEFSRFVNDIGEEDIRNGPKEA